MVRRDAGTARACSSVPTASFGRTIPLKGRLTMPGGNPLAGADIEVWERVNATCRSLATDQPCPHVPHRAIQVQGATRPKPRAALSVPRHSDDPSALHRSRSPDPRGHVLGRDEASRRKRRRSRVSWPAEGPAAQSGWQAHPSAGLHTWSLVHLRHTASRALHRALAASIPVHGDAWPGGLPVPCAGSPRGWLPLRHWNFPVSTRDSQGLVMTATSRSSAYGEDMKRLRGHLSYANVMATIAVFIALGGTSYAVASLPRNSVGSKQIRTNSVGTKELRRGAVRSTDVKDRSIRLRDVSLVARNLLRGQAGPPGPPGPAGVPLSVAVGRGGNVISGTPNVGTNHDGSGQGVYDVVFDRDLRGCRAVATLAATPPETPPQRGEIVAEPYEPRRHRPHPQLQRHANRPSVPPDRRLLTALR